MALDYAPTLDRHDARRKVGVITRAEIVRQAIEVGGFLYARDFPEIVSTVSSQPSAVKKGGAMEGKSARAPQPSTNDQLGMSYEIADALVEDINASVWVLNRVTFTGAAILKREKAAYRATWIELERGPR